MTARDLTAWVRRRWRWKPVKQTFVVTHRWSALVLGLVLLIGAPERAAAVTRSGGAEPARGH